MGWKKKRKKKHMARDSNATDRWVADWLRQQAKICEPWHECRYAATLAFIEWEVARSQFSLHESNVLDVGGESQFTQMLRDRWAAYGTQVLNDPRAYDCRYEPSVRDEQLYDIILMTEVIEHLHDLPTHDPDARAMWVGSGQVAALHELKLRLKPGGFIVVTTPNTCSLRTLYKVARQNPPRTFEPHVRELTQKELYDIVQRAGLIVAAFQEHVVWGHHGLTPQELELARAACRVLGANPDRGDIFMLTAKAAT